MAIAIPVQIQWLGRLDKYGELAAGSVAPNTVLIAAFQVPATPGASGQNQGNIIAITDFAGSADAGSVNTRIYIQKSSDGNTWTTVARISLASSGNYHRTYRKPIYIANGQFCRVTCQQDTAGGVSAELKGETAQSDVVDI